MAMDILRYSQVSAVRFFNVAGGSRRRSCSSRSFNVRSLSFILLETKLFNFLSKPEIPSLVIPTCVHFFRANLPFPQKNAKYYKELEAAVDVVQRACRLCVHVMFSATIFPILFCVLIFLKFMCVVMYLEVGESRGGVMSKFDFV